VRKKHLGPFICIDRIPVYGRLQDRQIWSHSWPIFNYHHIKKVLDSSVSMPCCASTSLHSTSVEAMQKLLVGRQEGHLACKKTEWWGAGMVICLEWGADLHMAQLMPLPLTVYCFNKIRIGFTCLVPAQPGSRASRGQRAVKRVRACVSPLSLWFSFFTTVPDLYHLFLGQIKLKTT